MTDKNGFNRSGRRRYEHIAEHFQLLCFTGQLKEGDRLPSEREIAERFGVGRSTVREALFSLQGLGIIELSSGAAARVIRPDPHKVVKSFTGVVRLFLTSQKGVKQMQHARLLFETGLVREAARCASKEGIAAIERALNDNERALGDQQAFERTDVAFHYAIACSIGNPIFLALHDGIADWLSEQRKTSARGGAKQEPVLQEHRAIFEAIAARDVNAAAEAMEAHLHNVARLYWKSMAIDPGRG